MQAPTLARAFPLLALLLVMVAGLTLGALVHRHEVAQVERMAEERNASLAQILRRQTKLELTALLSGSAVADPARFTRVRDELVDLLQDSDIVKLKVYDLRGITVFSTQASQIGEDKSGNAGFQQARTGRVATELTHRNQFSSFEGVVNEVDLVSSYVPVVDGAQVVGVFELYQNVTPLMRRIDDELWRLAGMVCAVLGTLYLLLVAIVRQSQRSLVQRDAQLAEANRLLDQRVAQRTAQLQASEARLTCLSEMSSDFFWETDGELRLVRQTLNQRQSADIYRPADDLVGRRVWELPVQLMDGTPLARWQGWLQAHKPLRGVAISRRRANGTMQYLQVSGDAQFDHQGVFTGYLGVGTDITQRVEAEAALRIADAAFEAQDATMVTDANAVIIRVNKAFVEITGYSAEEAIGQTPRLLRSDRHDAAFYRAMWESIHTTGHWRGEVWDRRKDGEVYPKWLTISTVTAQDGRVTHYIGTHFDISDRKKAEERIAELAFFDPLTRLPNRTLLRDRLHQALSNSQRDGSHGAALFIDLDAFKTLNDTQGHAVGDLLLQQVGTRLRQCVREGDTVARLGGDEFVVVLNGLSGNADEAARQVKLVGRKLLDLLALPYALTTTEHQLTASVGATLFLGSDSSLDEVLKQADLAMYRAKDSGRNALRFFDPDMQSAVVERSKVEKDLRQAISEQQFELHYQALVSGDRKLVGVESLVRWNHPQRGLVSPGEFIALAEETGLIVPLGHWVLESACRQIAAWAEHPRLSHVTVAVNVSARQFYQDDFSAQVLAVLERTGADPSRLKLELTESLLIDNMDDVIAKMTALRALGVQFSLDDFGTGYSSLAYLSRLPFDQVKIDRSFVSNIESSDDSVAICAAIVSLGHSLKLKVVAEGVETEAQRYFLSTVHRCDYLQGYLFSQPLPLAQFEIYAHGQMPVLH